MTRPSRTRVAARAFKTVRYIWRHPANRDKRLRKLAEAFAFQVRGRLFGRPTLAKVGERSQVLVRVGRGQAGFVYANPLEWPEVHCWRRVLRSGDLFVDIGANIGVYSIWAIEAGASVVAVEPDPESAGMLRENLRLNGYEQSARVVEAAVADRPGTMRFTTGLGVLNHLVLEDGNTVRGALREVPVTTLDNLLGDRSAAGAKIDVEGAEALVLQGARRSLADGRIALIHLEWNSCSQTLLGRDRSPIVDLLQEYGYRLYRPDMEGVLHPLVDTGPGPDVFAARALPGS